MKTIQEQADGLIEEHYNAFWLGYKDRVANINAVEMIRAAIITVEKQIESINKFTDPVECCELDVEVDNLKSILDELKSRLN